MNKDISIRIRGKMWKLRFARVPDDHNGNCDSPTAKGKSIRIRPSLSGEKRLEVLIHEMMHAAHWDLDEEVVSETSQDIARALWRIGYRD